MSIYRSIYIMILMVLFSCGEKAQQEEVSEAHHNEEENVVEFSDAQMKNAGVMLGKIEEKQISGTIKVNGVLDVPPQQLVSISAPLGGFLRNTKLLQGSRVQRGEVIAVIENIDFIQIQQDYLEAKSNYEFAKMDYQRQQNLSKENVNSEKIVQQAKSNYQSWQAKFSALGEKLKVLHIAPSAIENGNITSSINLYSPINGYVTEVNVNIGKFVSPTDVLFEIVDTEHLHAELIVFERDVPKLALRQKVRFTLANETKERMASVYLIGREIREDRTIQIHCHIDESDKELLPGMYLNAVVETGSGKVPALPEEAIVDYRGERFVFVTSDADHDDHSTRNNQPKDDHKQQEKHNDGMRFELIPITVGNSELGFTEISSDNIVKLKEHQVVVKGAYAILSKMKNSEEEGGHAH